jgi:hypothetical protein
MNISSGTSGMAILTADLLKLVVLPGGSKKSQTASFVSL